jgi:outer membrane protein
MKRIVTALALVCLLGIASAATAAEGTKLGFVDVQKVLLLSEAGKEAKEQLSLRANKYEGDKNAREEELKKLKADLEKQSVLLSETARGAKEKDYQQKYKEYQRFVKDAQDDLQAKNEELTNKLVDEIIKVIQGYGRSNGYTFIFVRNESMLYADDKADLTDEMLKSFNASRKK